MSDENEIPTDAEVLAALSAHGDGMTPSELFAVLTADHSPENVIRAMQRVLDRGKVELNDGARLVAVQELERIAA